MAAVNNDALQCNWCKEETNRLVGVVVKLCKCKLVGYCGEAHRKADLSNHEAVCLAKQNQMHEFLRTGAIAVVAGTSIPTFAKAGADQERVSKNDRAMREVAAQQACIAALYSVMPEGPLKQQLAVQQMEKNAEATKLEIENFRLGADCSVVPNFFDRISPTTTPEVQEMIRAMTPALQEEVQKYKVLLAEMIELGTTFIASVEQREFVKAARLSLENSRKKRDFLVVDIAIMEKYVSVLRARDPNDQTAKVQEQILAVKRDQLAKLITHLKTMPEEKKEGEKK